MNDDNDVVRDKEKRVAAPANYEWSIGVNNPLPHSLQVGQQVFVGGQLPLDVEGEVLDWGDIKQQTRTVFEHMKKSLEAAGAELADLVRLNTYYVYDGPEDEATAFWEAMTEVRLEYLPDPGPAATAVRVRGMPYEGCSIQIEGVAFLEKSKSKRQRIMPPDSWDWSIPVPLSQGWRVKDRVFVGGQISADSQGRAVASGDIGKQTRNVMRFVRRVVEEAGGSLRDVVRLKICYRHNGDQAEANDLLGEILEIVGGDLSEGGTAISAFGVNLLYEGLDLEIDAMAVLGDGNEAIWDLSIPPVRGFPVPAVPGVRANEEVYVAGQMALDDKGLAQPPGDHARQLEVALGAMEHILEKAGGSLQNLVKLNVFYVKSGDREALRDCFEALSMVIRRAFENSGSAAPVMTAVRVNGLPVEGALVQVDGLAIVGSC